MEMGVAAYHALLDKVKVHSNAGARLDKTHGLLVGTNCCDLGSFRIIHNTYETWLYNERALRDAHEQKWHLGNIVAITTRVYTEQKFSWYQVARILESSTCATETHIKIFEDRYPGSLQMLECFPNHQRMFKRIAQDLAKCALWIESLTFLIREGFEEQLKQAP